MSSPDVIAEHRQILQRMLNSRVPTKVNAGGYQTAVAYKKAVETARKVLASSRATLIGLQGAIQGLRAYED